MVAQTQKVLFLCNCYSTTLVRRSWEEEWRQNHCHGGSRVAVVAEWRHSGRLSDRSMDAIGRPHYFTGRPMADPCASNLRPRPCMCLPTASFERPVSDRPPRRPLCDCFEHAQNFTATMASMATLGRPLSHP